MLKEAIEKIISIDKTIVTKEIGGRIYSKGDICPVMESFEQAPGVMEFNTLAGLADFSNAFIPPVETDEGALFFHVDSPTSVKLFGAIQTTNFNTRFCYAKAGLNSSSFNFSAYERQHWYDLELFVISLQSMFVQNEMLETIIDMLGSVANENVLTQADDGFSQSLQIRTGITTRERQTVKNPCGLKPYRTFREIDQPEGKFILRLKKDNEKLLKASLWVADGGAWKDDAMAMIKAWLEKETELKAIA